MNQRALFAMLGAPLTNSRWSWGAVRPEDGAVFLRVWQDRMQTHDGSQFVQITNHARFRNGPANCGYRERLKHVELIRGGAPRYLIVCEAVDPAARPRRIRSFNAAEVFPGGRVVELNGDWWVEVLPGVAVQEVRLSPTGGRA
jgi:hypothetical protein